MDCAFWALIHTSFTVNTVIGADNCLIIDHFDGC